MELKLIGYDEEIYKFYLLIVPYGIETTVEIMGFS